MTVKEFKETIRVVKKQLKSFKINLGVRKQADKYVVNIESPKNPLVIYNGSYCAAGHNLFFDVKELTKAKLLKEIEYSVHNLVDFFIWSKEGTIIDTGLTVGEPINDINKRT